MSEQKMREALARLRLEAKWIERDQHKYAECAYSPSADTLECIADDIEAALAEQPEQPAQGKSERSNRQFLTPDWIAAEDAAGGVMAAGALATSEQPAQVEAVAAVATAYIERQRLDGSWDMVARFTAPADPSSPDGLPRDGIKVYTAPPAPAVPDDALLLDALTNNHWKIEPFNRPTGGDDADVGWRVIEYRMPSAEVEIARIWSDDPREAIRAAMLATAPEVPRG